MIQINFYCRDEDLNIDFWMNLPFAPHKGQFVHVPDNFNMSSGLYKVASVEIVIEEALEGSSYLEDYYLSVVLELDHLR
jgi:hypothetical protein